MSFFTRNSRLLIFFLASCCLVAPGNSVADLFYVATEGSDANPGTKAAPWKTIQHAADQLSPGDTAFVRHGSYPEAVHVNVSGSLVAGPVRFRAYPGETPILDGSGLTPSPENTALFVISDQHDVVIDGFELRDYHSSSPAVVPMGIYVNGTSHHVEIRNNNIHDIRTSVGGSCDVDANGNAHGIAVYGDVAPASIHDVLIEGNDLHHLTLGCSESLVINGNVEQFIVRKNKVHDNDNIGLDFIGFEETSPDPAFDQARDGVVSDNHIYAIDSSTNPVYAGEKSAGGIYVDGGTRITIERNHIHDSNIGVEIASEHAGRSTSFVTVRNNFIYQNHIAGIAMGGYDTHRGSTENCKIINNTLYHNDSEQDGNGEFYIQFDTRNNLIKNNIVVANNQGVLMSNAYTQNVDNIVDYNLYFTPLDAVDSEWQWKKLPYQGFSNYRNGSGNDAHSLFIDPLFSNTVEPDLHLLTSSPAIDAGEVLADAGGNDIDAEPRSGGSTIELGADEVYSLRPQQVSLPGNQWHQLSIPCQAGPDNTVGNLFSDDIAGTYGTDWVIFEFDPVQERYINPGLSGLLFPGQGYWVYQQTGSTVTIDLPESCLISHRSGSTQCSIVSGCFEQPLSGPASQVTWQMLGSPDLGTRPWQDLRIATDEGICTDADGCTLSEASGLNIFHHEGWHYDPGSGTYNVLQGNVSLGPWDGYWAATLTGASDTTPRLLIPAP